MLKKKRDSGWRPLWRLLDDLRFHVAGLSLVSFGAAIFEAGILVLLTKTVMTIAGGQKSIDLFFMQPSLMGSLAAVATMLLVRLALDLISVRLSAGLSLRVMNGLRARLSRAYLRSSWDLQQNQPSGRLQELLTTSVSQSVGAIGAFSSWITAWLSLAAFLTTAVIVDPAATGLVIVALLLLGFLLGPVRTRIRRRGAVHVRTGLAFTNSVAELGSLGLEMQAFGVQDKFADRIRALSLRPPQVGAC